MHFVFLLDENREGKDQPCGVEVPEPVRAREEPDSAWSLDLARNRSGRKHTCKKLSWTLKRKLSVCVTQSSAETKSIGLTKSMTTPQVSLTYRLRTTEDLPLWFCNSSGSSSFSSSSNGVSETLEISEGIPGNAIETSSVSQWAPLSCAHPRPKKKTPDRPYRPCFQSPQGLAHRNEALENSLFSLPLQGKVDVSPRAKALQGKPFQSFWAALTPGNLKCRRFQVVQQETKPPYSCQDLESSAVPERPSRMPKNRETVAETTPFGGVTALVWRLWRLEHPGPDEQTTLSDAKKRATYSLNAVLDHV